MSCLHCEILLSWPSFHIVPFKRNWISFPFIYETFFFHSTFHVTSMILSLKVNFKQLSVYFSVFYNFHVCVALLNYGKSFPVLITDNGFCQNIFSNKSYIAQCLAYFFRVDVTFEYTVDNLFSQISADMSLCHLNLKLMKSFSFPSDFKLNLEFRTFIM